MILALSDLAELMTSYTIERSRSSIKKMLSVEDENAWKVLPDGRVESRPIGEIRTGDEVEAHTGEKLAVDGVITSGAAVIDQSAITGEFEPAEKAQATRSSRARWSRAAACASVWPRWATRPWSPASSAWWRRAN